MSNTTLTFLKLHPLLTSYAQKGLINFNALARYLKENNLVDVSTSLAAVGMDLRRHLSKLPIVRTTPVDFSKYSLQLVIRTNINELVVNKKIENRKHYKNIFDEISKTKYFISVVEGETEVVIMTDYPINELQKKWDLGNSITHFTDELGFISINFPIEFRQIPGIYNAITSSLAERNISIHSFHTIGGEILILVKNADLNQSEEILKSLLTGVA